MYAEAGVQTTTSDEKSKWLLAGAGVQTATGDKK